MCYLSRLVGSPAVLVAVEAGQQHILICVHLAEAQSLMRVITDYIVAVEQFLSLWFSILKTERKKRKYMCVQVSVCMK